jgi:hypothetical protein
MRVAFAEDSDDLLEPWVTNASADSYHNGFVIECKKVYDIPSDSTRFFLCFDF